MLFRVMPRQKIYFESFERCAKAGTEASRLLLEMLRGGAEKYEAALEQIGALEEEGDAATRAVIETLNNNLATPFDRADIRELAETLDDVLDGIDTVGHKLVTYRAFQVRSHAIELAELLNRMTPALERLVATLPTARNEVPVLELCRELHALESEADKVLRRGVGALFEELKDAFELIKWKEILEVLESTTDKCAGVAKVVEEVVRKRT